jgi:hypothetical protein
MAVELATAFVSIVPDTKRVGPAVRRAFRDADRDAHAAGERHGKEYSRGFGSRVTAGLKGATAGFLFMNAAVTSTVRHIGTLSSTIGFASRMVRFFSVGLLAGATGLRAIAGVSLARLGVGLGVVAKGAGALAKQVTRAASAFLVFSALVKGFQFMMNFAKLMSLATIGTSLLLGVVSGLSTMIGGVLVKAVLAAGAALGVLAGAAAGIAAPAFASLMIVMSGLKDGAKEFLTQFKDADKAFSEMVGKRMAPLLLSFRQLRMEMVDTASAGLAPTFGALGRVMDHLRPSLIAVSGTLVGIANQVTGSLAGPAALSAFDRMTAASNRFFGSLNQGENGLGGLASGLLQFVATAAETFAGAGSGINDFLLRLGERLAAVRPEQMIAALQKAKQVFLDIWAVASPIVSLFRQLGEVSATALAPGFTSIGAALRDATPGMVAMAENLMPALGQVMTNLAPLLPALVQAFTPWSEVLAVLAPHIASLITWLGPMAPMILGVALAFKVITAGIAIYNTVMLIASNATRIAQAAMWLFNAALMANPIGIIVAAIAALAAGLVLFFTKTEIGRKIWATIWDGIKAAVANTWDFMKGAFESIKNAIGGVIDFVQRWWKVLILALGPIGLVVNGVMLLVKHFDLVKAAIGFLGDIVTWVFHAVIAPALNFIIGIINAWWVAAQVVFALWKEGVQLTGDIVMWLWHTAIEPAFNAMGAVIGMVWNTIIQPIFEAMKAGLRFVGDAAIWLWNNALVPAWEGIKSVISSAWTGVILPVFDAMKAAFNAVGEAFKFVWESVIKPAWDALGTGIGWVVDNIVKPAFDGLKNALSAVGDFFGTVVGGIQSAWDGIRKAVAVPINFVIETVWNNGLVKAWNAVTGWLPGLKEAKPLIPVQFAQGGSVSGGRRGKDSVPAMLMPEEHVWDVPSVKAAGGQDVMFAMRNLIKRGVPFSWDTVKGLSNAAPGVVKSIATAPRGADMLGFLQGIVPGYKDGGPVVRPAWEFQLEAGHEFAMSRNGNPYTWGFEDCSGYMSSIADKILGGPGVRRWATSSFPGGQPWQPGLAAGFSVGVHDDPGGPGGGHTAGTLTGVGRFATTNVESGGSHGNVAYGGPAVGADSPQWDGVRPGRFHLGIGADGAFVSGGVGGGPSPDEQKGFLADKLRKAIDFFLDPVKGLLPQPPPEFLSIPGKAMDSTREAAIRVAMGVIDNLGGSLRTVFEGAQKVGDFVGDVAGKAWDGITSVFRDRGGFIPNGLTLVRNETGKPEAVLNWEQLEDVRKSMTEGKSFVEAVKDLNVQPPSDEDAAKANRTLGPGTTIDQLRSLIFEQKMTSVTASSTKEFMGSAGKIIGESLWDIFTPFSDFPDPLAIADRYTIKPTESSTSATSSGASNAPAADTKQEPPAPAGPGAGDYVGWIAKAAKDKGLPFAGAVVGVGTSLTEAGNPIKMWANNAVPESLKFPHDAVGSDHDSVGIFQQRPSWGSVADLMDPYKSAGLFYNALTAFDWQSMPAGDAAQKVQRSAYPAKYAPNMVIAEELLKGKFDNGGMIPPGISLMDNQTRKYEPAVAFNPDQWTTLNEIANGGGGGVDARFIVEKLVVADWKEAQREMKSLGIRHQMRYSGRPGK